MELPVVLREALELQVLETEPEKAATVIGTGVAEHGSVAVAQILLDASAVAFRRMVALTDEAFDLAELLSQLALDGAVPEHRLELLQEILTASASTAGGIRPPVEALYSRLGEQDLLFGAWLGLLTALRVASIAIEATEPELLEHLLLSFDVDPE
ncbi:MAG: hypothetical protein M3Z03_17095 [Actinomycetota bacterium]|nr:hypothetical protein [Actinomycetota bacterium]